MLYKIINLFIRIYNGIFAFLQQVCLKMVDFHFISALFQTLFFQPYFYLFAIKVPGNLDVCGNRYPSYHLFQQEAPSFAGHRFHRWENIRKGDEA